MSKDDFEFEQAQGGYLSDYHKRKFTITAGILGAVFFLAQFFIPFIAMMAYMPFMFFGGNSWMNFANPAKGALKGDSIWYVESSVSAGPVSTGSGTDIQAVLKQLNINRENEPEEVGPVIIENPWLLPGTNRLWVISSSGLGYYQNNEFFLLSDQKTLGDISKPFMYKGSPAVIEQSPEGLALKIFKNGSWDEELSFSMDLQGDQNFVHSNIQVLSNWDQIHVFIRYGNTLYYGKGLSLENNNDVEFWKPVANVGHNWTAVLINNIPTVFAVETAEGFPKITGYKQVRQDLWETFFEYKKSLATEIGVFAVPETDRFIILSQSFPGSLRLIIADANGMIKETRFGSGFPFGHEMMAMMFIPYAGTMLLPILLTFILSVLMAKHRITEHWAESGALPQASLIRRALAQLIDSTILMAPIIGALFLVFPEFDFEAMFFSKDSVFLILFITAGGFLWIIIGFLVFSFLEGKWGKTPGKLTTGIKVLGLDHNPCGFGRALIRNLLKFLDGFFSFLVGIMVVAMSENWQRIGDMAASTVVVRTKD